MPFRKAILLPLFLITATYAKAGYVTTNEQGMDAVFSQASFGNTPVDIRFNTSEQIYNQNLLSIDTPTEWLQLLSLAPAASPTVDAFFVDAIHWCGSYLTADGCGQGHVFAVVSSVAAGINGTELMSHELGHDLGLSDLSCNTTNLMCDLREY